MLCCVDFSVCLFCLFPCRPSVDFILQDHTWGKMSKGLRKNATPTEEDGESRAVGSIGEQGPDISGGSRIYKRGGIKQWVCYHLPKPQSGRWSKIVLLTFFFFFLVPLFPFQSISSPNHYQTYLFILFFFWHKFLYFIFSLISH